MEYVIGGLVAALPLVLVVGAITGRVSVKSCCSMSDPAKDRRMRGAFPDVD